MRTRVCAAIMVWLAAAASSHAVVTLTIADSNSTYDDWTQNLTQSVTYSGSLAGIDLSDDYLPFANFAGVNLAGAKLTGTNLAAADLTYANLANFIGFTQFGYSDLTGANFANTSVRGLFVGANLTGANFAGATLTYANFAGNYAGANLTGATFTGANLSGVDFSGINLSHAQGLSTTTFSAGNAPVFFWSTDFTGTGFNPIAAGWTLAVPEASRAVLMLGGFAALLLRRRR